MKNKRFWAALLCMAMIFTSQSFNVSAAMQDGLLTDESTVMAVEADEISEPLSDVEEVQNDGSLNEGLIEEDGLLEDRLLDFDTLAEEPELLLEDDESFGEISDSGIPEIEQPEGEASACFKTGTKYLELVDTLSDLSGYTSVVIPKDVEIISANTALFVRNSKTTEVSFEGGSKLTTIEAGAFDGSAITQFRAPDSYTTISANTFKGCLDLAQFAFNNVEKIGDSAFEGCVKLKKITGGESVTAIGQYAFKGAGFDRIGTGTEKNFIDFTQPSITVSENAFEACPYLLEASLPKGFTTIPQYCFKSCSALTKVTIGNNTEIIEKNAFYGCSKLNTINFGNVKTVSDNAFTNCTAIEKLDFPESVTTIGAYAFPAFAKKNVVATFYYKNSEGIADEKVLHIADTAFGAPRNMTFVGYDGAVKKYADKMNAPYRPILVKHKITIDGTLKAHDGAVKCSGTGVSWNSAKYYDAVNGQTVKVVITPGQSYTLIDGSLNDTLGPDTRFEYSSGSMESQVYTFVMPNRDVNISGSYVANSKISGATFSYKIEDDAFVYKKDGEKNWKVDKSGYKGTLRITATDKDSNTYAIGPWMYNFESKATNGSTVASIDSKGIITAVEEGKTTITANPSDKSPAKKISFDLTVGETVKIDNIWFADHAAVFPSTLYGYGEVSATPQTFDDNDPDKIKANHPYIITYNKSDLNSSDQTFKLRLKLKDDKGDTTVYGKVSWSVANEKIATLKNKSNYDNCNEITVKKGAEGEVLIKATATGYIKDERTKKNEVLNAYAILKIVDTNPRVTSTEVRVNKQRDGKDPAGPGGMNKYAGTQISVIPAADNAVVGDAFKTLAEGGTFDEQLYQYDKNKNLSIYRGLRLMWDVSGEGYMANPDPNTGRYYYRIYSTGEDATINALKEGQTKTFSGDNKLYIHGKYDKDSSADFYIPIQKLIVYNEKLKPTIKMTGDINLFYNSSCYAPFAGTRGFAPLGASIDKRAWEEIMGTDAKETDPDNQLSFVKKTVNFINLTQSIPETTAVVDYIHSKLVSAENYNRYKLNEDDSQIILADDAFYNNFTVWDDFDSDNNFNIYRTGEDLKKKNNKELTSGYLLIYFEGYSKPSPVKVNLQVKNVKPSYVMSETKVKANNNNSMSTFKFKILTKDKKSEAVINSDLAADGLKILSANSTPNVYAGLTNASMDDKGIITLKAAGALPTGSSKAVISVKKKHWYRTIDYTYNVTTTGSAPKARMAKSKVYLNSNMLGVNGSKGSTVATMILDQSDCTAGIDSIEYAGTDSLSGGATEMLKNCVWATDNDFPNKVNINFALKDAVQKGNYKFKIVPTSKYTGGTATPLAKPVYVTVNVSDQSPAIVLAKSSYVFNVDYPGHETYTVRIKNFKGMPAGIIGQNVDIISANCMDFDTSGLTVTYTGKSKSAALGDAIANELKKGMTFSDVKQDKKTKKYYYEVYIKIPDKVTSEAFTLPFAIGGIKINGAAIKPCKITVKGKSVEPKVVLKASGKINTADPTSFISYKFSMKNLVDPVVGGTAKVYEDGKESDQFELVLDQEHKTIDDMRWQLKAKHNPNDGTVETDEKGYDKSFRSGKHVLIFEFTVAGKLFQTGKINVTPKQSLSKLKAKPNKTSFYAGTAPANRVTSVDIYKTSELKTFISDVKLSNSNSSEVKSAFKVIRYTNMDVGDWRASIRKKQKSDWAGYVDIQCVNPSVLKAGKTYTLILETQTEGQFYKWDADKKIVKDAKGKNVVTTGSTVKINVVVYN